MKTTRKKLRSNVKTPGLLATSLMVNSAIIFLAVIFILFSSLISNASPPNNVTKSSLRGITLGIGSEINAYKSETLIIFYDTTYKAIRHNYDVPKMVEPDLNVPKISSLSVFWDDHSINFFPSVNGSYKIPIRVTVGISGTYTISLLNLYSMSESSYITLEDLFTGKMIDLNHKSAYDFYMENTTTIPRFMLHIGAPMTFSIQKVTFNI